MLGSCYFVLKGKSWREWQQQQLFLYSEEKGRNKADCLERQSSLCMESRLPRVKTHKVETTAGVKTLNGNWGVTGGSLENSELTTPGDPVTGALPQHCDIYLQELHQIPQYILGKNLLELPAGGAETRTILKYTRGISSSAIRGSQLTRAYPPGALLPELNWPRQHVKKQRHCFTNKVCLVKTMVFPVVMYGCESWTIKKAERGRIDAFELWSWRRLLRVPWTPRRSNQSILKGISPEYSLEGLMLKLKLLYCGHLIWRTDSLEKTQMLGMIEGRRRRGQ